MLKTMKAITAANGIDNIQAPIIFLVVLHLTAFVLWHRPAPIIEPLATCVELTGNPKNAANPNINELLNSTENPWYGLKRVILVAIVLTIFHPAKNVPKDIVIYEAIITQSGTLN